MRTPLPLLAGLLIATSVAHAADPCEGYTWDVRAERAAFAREARDGIAGKAAADAPALELATPYTLVLAAQADVRFAAGPGKASLPDGVHAGLATVRLAHAGRYRVALDTAAWLDVVIGGKIVPSRAFTGRSGCSAPHKIVEYDLPAGDATIQVSAATPEHIRLAITEAPAN